MDYVVVNDNVAGSNNIYEVNENSISISFQIQYIWLKLWMREKVIVRICSSFLFSHLSQFQIE